MREFWYGIIRSIFNILTYGIIDMKVYGEEHIPAKAPFIVACNHASNFDPPLLGTAMRPYLIHFMAKEELFRNPLMNWFLRYVGTFPVHRGRIDRQALVEAIRVLKTGHVLGIFPEGTRGMEKELLPFHEGMAAIAVKTGVPVVPAAIIGSRDLPKKNGPVCVVFGPALTPAAGKKGKEEISSFNEQVRQAIMDLKEQYGNGRSEGETR